MKQYITLRAGCLALSLFGSLTTANAMNNAIHINPLPAQSTPQTTNYTVNGHYAGTAQVANGGVVYYNQNGQYQGQSTNTPGQNYFYTPQNQLQQPNLTTP